MCHARLVRDRSVRRADDELVPVDLDFDSVGRWIKRKTLVCVECGHRAPESARGWRVEVVAEDADGEALAAYCPLCWTREFG